jgi:hypothetical protein
MNEWKSSLFLFLPLSPYCAARQVHVVIACYFYDDYERCARPEKIINPPALPPPFDPSTIGNGHFSRRNILLARSLDAELEK